jgi:hypothetical protein
MWWAGVVVVMVLTTACGSSTAPTSDGCPAPPYIPAPTTGWPCPPAAVIRSIDSEFLVQFNHDPTAGTLVCRAADGSVDLTRLQERAYQALYLIKQLEFDTPLPWTNLRLWTWFVGAVRGVRFDRGTHANCCADDRIIFIPANDGSSIWPPGFPTMIYVLVHEARHGDGLHFGSYYHTCGRGTMDTSLAEMGAFGVQYYFAVWVATHTVSPALTMDERRAVDNAAALLLTSAFCHPCGI